MARLSGDAASKSTRRSVRMSRLTNSSAACAAPTTAMRARRYTVSCSRSTDTTSTAATTSNRDAAAIVAWIATIAARHTLRCSFWEKGWPPYGDPFLRREGQAVARDLACRHDQSKEVVKSPIVGNRCEHRADEPADEACAHPEHVLAKRPGIVITFRVARGALTERQRELDASLGRDGSSRCRDDKEGERQQAEYACFGSDLNEHIVCLDPSLFSFRRVVVLELPDADARERVLEERVDAFLHDVP